MVCSARATFCLAVALLAMRTGVAVDLASGTAAGAAQLLVGACTARVCVCACYRV